MNVLDEAPSGRDVTDYDRENAKLYLRLLDAEAAGAAWTDAARQVLKSDPFSRPERARLQYESHLARAKWLRDGGFAALLRP